MSAHTNGAPRRRLLTGYEPETYPKVRAMISILRGLGHLDYFAKDDRGLSPISDPSKSLGKRSSFGSGLKGVARRLRDHRRLISRSSGQLADYLRLGIPVIAFLTPEMGRFVTAGVGQPRTMR